jgi:hypothetical protein
MRFLLLFFYCLSSWASPESFRIEYKDRSLKVISPENKKNQFAVIIENQSLSDLYGKFRLKEKDLKFVTIKSGQTKAVEFAADASALVYFIPLSPAFQNIPLEFGKKTYEIPRSR